MFNLSNCGFARLHPNFIPRMATSAETSIKAWGIRAPAAPAAAPPRCYAACCRSLAVGLTDEVTKVPLGSRTWRQRLGHAMENHNAHAAILILIFLDVGAVLCEVMIRNVCVQPPPGTPDAARLFQWGEGLSWASRSILLVLLLHLIALMVAFGGAFFKKWAYLVDLLIVCVALSLEMAHLVLELQHGAHGGASHLAGPALGASEDPHDIPGGLAGDGGALIIVLLSWRVVRIIHGFAVTGAAHTDEQELKEAREEIGELKKKLDALSGGSTVESARVLSALRNSAQGTV